MCRLHDASVAASVRRREGIDGQLATGRNPFGRTLNPKVAGSMPPRPTLRSPARFAGDDDFGAFDVSTPFTQRSPHLAKGQADRALNVRTGRALSPYRIRRSSRCGVRWARSIERTPFGRIRAICIRLAVRERRQSLGRALRVHRLPDREISLELDVRVGSREGLWPCRRIDDPGVDHLDDALAAPQILGQGGGRSR
jgi:hypothetical protein